MSIRNLLWGLEASVAPTVMPATVTVWMGGQSNNAGVKADATYGSAALAAGVTCWYQGVNLANWSATPGFAPWLAAALQAAGATNVQIVMQAYSGSALQTTHQTYADLAVRELAARGWTPDLLHFWQGEAEADTGSDAETANAWGEQFRRLSFRCRKAYPDCRIINTELRTTDGTAYPFHTNVRASQQALVGTIGNFASLDSSSWALNDNVHVEADATGYGLAATAAAAAFV